MSVTLAHYFREVASFDVFDYSFGRIADFLKVKHADQSFDWVITNPPFRLGEEFINRSMKIARHGVAMLTRTVFIESVGRYERLFKSNPPSRFAQFTERVPMVKGRVDKRASTATGYAWLVWEKDSAVALNSCGYQLVAKCSNARVIISKRRACRIYCLRPSSQCAKRERAIFLARD
jgi:hypothetical protein